MLLQQIVATLDGELERLLSLRKIVSGLAGASVLETKVELELPVSTRDEPKRTTPVKKMRPAREGKAVPRERPASVRPRRQPETTALRGSIPAAPVVVTAEALAREGARLKQQTSRKQAEPTPAPGSLGSMIRALRLDAAS